MKILTGLFRAARKRLMTTDNDMGVFRDKLNELVEQKDTLTEEDVAAKVEELKGIANDLPDNDEKSKLFRFLEDFNSIKEQDATTAKEAASMVADVFEKLDTEAMKDVPGNSTESADQVAEETAETETVTPEETAEETEAPAEAEDEDPNPECTLEEIYQFCKKRQAEDAAAKTSCESEEDTEDSAEETEEVTEEEKEEDVVTDHAPFIPVTLNKTKPNGTLAAMFGEIKNGGR